MQTSSRWETRDKAVSSYMERLVAIGEAVKDRAPGVPAALVPMTLVEGKRVPPVELRRARTRAGMQMVQAGSRGKFAVAA